MHIISLLFLLFASAAADDLTESEEVQPFEVDPMACLDSALVAPDLTLPERWAQLGVCLTGTPEEDWVPVSLFETRPYVDSNGITHPAEDMAQVIGHAKDIAAYRGRARFFSSKVPAPLACCVSSYDEVARQTVRPSPVYEEAREVLRRYRADAYVDFVGQITVYPRSRREMIVSVDPMINEDQAVWASAAFILFRQLGMERVVVKRFALGSDTQPSWGYEALRWYTRSVRSDQEYVVLEMLWANQD